MILAVPTSDEACRLESLQKYNVLNTPPDQALDDLTTLAAYICGAPIALISIVDEDRQWFKSKIGMNLSETRRDISFCGHAIHQRDLFIVPDAMRDERFADNPLVTGDPHIRFYAGAPLVSTENSALGTLCVIDHVARTLTPAQEQALRVLARQAMTHLELRRHMNELVEKEGTFRLLADNITDVLWVTSPDLARMYFVSAGYERIWGRSAADLYANPHQWIEAILPEDRGSVLATFSALMDDEPSVSAEYRIARPDKTIRWVHDRGFQVRDAAGKLLRLTGVATDITERKLAQIAALRMAEIVESSDDAIVSKTLDGIITSWNPAAERMFGYTPSEMVGEPITRLFPQDRMQEETEILARISRGERVRHFETVRVRKDGRPLNVSTTISPIRSADGNVSGVSKIIRDISERKKFEDQLLWRTAFFEAQVNSALDGILVVDGDGKTILQNQRMKEIWNFPQNIADEENDQCLLDWVTSQITNPSEFIEKVEFLYAHPEKISRDEIELVDGRVLDRYSAPVLGAGGKYYGRIWSFRDITERKGAEKALIDSEQKFRTLFDDANDAIFILRNGLLMDCNARGLELFGVTRDRLLGRSPSDFSPPSQPDGRGSGEKAVELTQRALAGDPQLLEWVHQRPDGTAVYTDVRLSRFELQGQFYVQCIARDITERKVAQEQIAEQAALLEKARDAIVVRDLEGKILFWNSGAERMYGWTRGEAIGRFTGDFVYADSVEFQESNDFVISNGEWHGELKHLTREKKEIIVEARWTLIRDNEGQPKSVLAINTDVTEKKKIEAQFMRAQRMESIGTLAGGIAHDLNNILAPIILSVDFLKSISDRPEATKILQTIEISAKRGADIVRQVLSFARGLEGRRIEVQSKHLLKDLEIIIKNTFPKDIRLKFMAPADLWTLLGDPTQVHQILLNLCVNARDAMPNGGELVVAVENVVIDGQYSAMNIDAKPGRYVLISVTDSGMGIPRENLEKIFEPFFTTKELNKGTGLGLSAVMAIVKSHAGFVNVYSELGKGTTFKIYLPATEMSSSSQKDRSQVVTLERGNGETVLVVDDEDAILVVTSQTLQAFGYRVLTATDGADALATYVQHKDEISVVLTDMMMPIMDGAATAQALLRVNPAVKIIAASGLAANGSSAKQSSGGVKHSLTKPYTAETLLKTIRTILTES